ncbi:hypothetical protein SAMD00019534_068740, partial [Acytostelium subglobosum LB1]|uniref:hypothetical protein n=1 Tax=Acytostelium subglobosum LB1 TaxID=1410327 RepID=UPI0006452291
MSNVILYVSSATAMLKTKKDQVSLKNLLDAKGIQYIEYDVASDVVQREHMRKVSGITTLPQVCVHHQSTNQSINHLISFLF